MGNADSQPKKIGSSETPRRNGFESAHNGSLVYSHALFRYSCRKCSKGSPSTLRFGAISAAGTFQKRLLFGPSPRRVLAALVTIVLLAFGPIAAAQTTFPRLVIQTGHMVGIHGLAFSPRVPWKSLGFPEREGSGEVLAVGGNDEILELWDTMTQHQIRTLASPGGVLTVVFSRDGILVAAGCQGKVFVWNVASGALVHTLPGPGRDVYRSLAFDPSGMYIAGGADHGVTVWNLTRDGVEHQWDGEYTSVAISNQSVLASTSAIGPALSKQQIIYVRDLKSGRDLHSFTADIGFQSAGLKFENNGKLIVWTGDAIISWDPVSNLQRKLTGPLGGTATASCIEGTRLLAGTNQGDVSLWDINAGTELYHSAQNDSFTDSVAL